MPAFSLSPELPVDFLILASRSSLGRRRSSNPVNAISTGGALNTTICKILRIFDFGIEPREEVVTQSERPGDRAAAVNDDAIGVGIW